MAKTSTPKIQLPIVKWAGNSAAVVVNESAKHLLVTVALDSPANSDVHLTVRSGKATSIENGHLAATSKDFINKPGGKYPEITIPKGQTQGSVYIEFCANLEIHPDLDYTLHLHNESPEIVKLGAGAERVLTVTIHQDATGEYQRVSNLSNGKPANTNSAPNSTSALTVTATPNPVTQGQPAAIAVIGALPNENLTQSATGAATYTITVKADSEGKYTTRLDGTNPKGTYNIAFTGQTSAKSGSISLVVQ